jgi:hypothetical protein
MNKVHTSQVPETTIDTLATHVSRLSAITYIALGFVEAANGESENVLVITREGIEQLFLKEIILYEINSENKVVGRFSLRIDWDIYWLATKEGKTFIENSRLSALSAEYIKPLQKAWAGKKFKIAYRYRDEVWQEARKSLGTSPIKALDWAERIISGTYVQQLPDLEEITITSSAVQDDQEYWECSSIVEFTLNSTTHIFTPTYFADTVAPYLQAIAELQQLICEARGNKASEINIRSIKHLSPISVSVEGITDAIELVRETIVPWRKKHAQQMASLLEKEKELEIERKRAEILEKRAEAEKERIELLLLKEQCERLKLENDKLRLELQRAKIELALEVLFKVNPYLSEEDKIGYVIKLLRPLDVLVTSELEIV